ncbi:MAG TPA: hypothetical protein VHM90_05050 [Phycisphaerae bacterium]|nr:hypothetical protein [Phycisphaerae bacterium]
MARDLPALANVRGELREKLRRSAACDAAGFARGFEGALRRGWELISAPR